ncbi:MAG TPA: hypothetical protein VF364_01590, partial [Candidatus Limnocylindria bacterium]
PAVTSEDGARGLNRREDGGSLGYPAPMKIGEWDNLGKARGLIQRQLGQLKVDELAAHVGVNPDNGRMRVLVATDIGLIDYSYSPAGADPNGAWILRGQIHRWNGIRGLRLQTDAQLDEASGRDQAVWRLVAEDPKIELAVTTDAGERPIEGLLAFGAACLQNAR